MAGKWLFAPFAGLWRLWRQGVRGAGAPPAASRKMGAGLLAGWQKGRTFAAMEQPVLSMDALSTGYGRGRRGRVVGRGLTGVLPPASLTALAGTNGAGKSTLLRTLAGFLPPLAGGVAWLGRAVGDYSPAELARVVAVVLTDRPDTGTLTAGEVAELGRFPYTPVSGRLSPTDRRIAREAMEEAGVAHLAAREFRSLSDGERQRVMIAKALAQQTPVVLLDEPTAFLDFPGKVAAVRLLAHLAHGCGKTVLLSTHDLELALQLADRLWLLSACGLVEGTPQSLSADGTIARLFAVLGTEYLPSERRFRLLADGR